MGQLIVARDLLHLLLTHHISLISYPCVFFTQVPLCPENGITFEDIGRIFGPPVLGWPVPAARRTMTWFLKRWNRISDGLLNAEPDAATAPSSSSSSLLRPDMTCSCSSVQTLLGYSHLMNRRKTNSISAWH
jgi:hypothetical protein